MGKCTAEEGDKVKEKQGKSESEGDCKVECGKDSKCTGFNFAAGKCKLTFSGVKGNGALGNGDCNIRDDSDKLVKKKITDRNGEEAEKEVHLFAPDKKASKNSAKDMIPHEKANDPAVADSTDKILPHYKRPR